MASNFYFMFRANFPSSPYIFSRVYIAPFEEGSNTHLLVDMAVLIEYSSQHLYASFLHSETKEMS